MDPNFFIYNLFEVFKVCCIAVSLCVMPGLSDIGSPVDKFPYDLHALTARYTNAKTIISFCASLVTFVR